MFKKTAIIFTAILLILSATACQSTKSNDMVKSSPNMSLADGRANYEKGTSSEAAKMDTGSAENPTTTSIAVDQVSRKVIFNANFKLQTKDYDKTINDLNLQIQNTKSYIQSSNTNGDKERGNANSTLVIRVPSDKYEQFKVDIAKLGNVLSSSEGGEDVTGDYFDKDARLNVLKAQEKRVLELLDKAQTIEDILKIEEQLTRVRAEIEQLTTVIKRYDDLISYSTITVSIYQTSDYVIKDDGFLTKLVETIKDSLKFGLSLIQNIVYAIVWLIPYLIVIGIIVIIFRKTIKKAIQKTNQKLFKKTPPTEK